MICTPGAPSEAVRVHVVGDMWLSEGLSKRTRNVVVYRVRQGTALNDIELFHVTRNVVLLTVRGRGTPGVRARVAAYRDKQERCALQDTTTVEERHVRAHKVKREAVIPECKLSSSLVLLPFPKK